MEYHKERCAYMFQYGIYPGKSYDAQEGSRWWETIKRVVRVPIEYHEKLLHILLFDVEMAVRHGSHQQPLRGCDARRIQHLFQRF